MSGGTDTVAMAGLASGTVLSGGREAIYSGGLARGTLISDGGLQTVLSGGVASNALVTSGGSEIISAGGVASRTEVTSGGTAIVSSGGVLNGLLVVSGGRLVDNGRVVIVGPGTLTGEFSGSGSLTKFGRGSFKLGGDGSDFSGKLVINGGTLELASAQAIGTGSVLFAPVAASATLQIDQADAPAPDGAFGSVISNFSSPNDYIDLRSIPFSAINTSAKVSGSTLVLTEGGKTYSFTLAGSIGGVFSVSDDGHGGTRIGAFVASFAQAAAGLAAPNAGNLLPAPAGALDGPVPLVTATGSVAHFVGGRRP